MKVENHAASATRAVQNVPRKDKPAESFDAPSVTENHAQIMSQLYESVLSGVSDIASFEPKKSRINRAAAFHLWRAMHSGGEQDGKQIERAWGFEGTKEELEEFRQWFRDNKGPNAPWNELTAAFMEKLDSKGKGEVFGDYESWLIPAESEGEASGVGMGYFTPTGENITLAGTDGEVAQSQEMLSEAEEEASDDQVDWLIQTGSQTDGGMGHLVLPEDSTSMIEAGSTEAKPIDAVPN
ncbi:MAG: hypothetical protein HWE20_04165 [Gammaproteobacteria bacterium]|nr:hypothetical protein [Gammaproteobacteria bacterium]